MNYKNLQALCHAAKNTIVDNKDCDVDYMLIKRSGEEGFEIKQVGNKQSKDMLTLAIGIGLGISPAHFNYNNPKMFEYKNGVFKARLDVRVWAWHHFELDAYDLLFNPALNHCPVEALRVLLKDGLQAAQKTMEN